MDQQEREPLQWFVNFANTDLDNVNPGDKAKLLVEAPEHLFPLNDLQQFDLGLKSPRAYRKYVRKMPWLSKIPKKLSKRWERIVELQIAVKRVLEGFCGMSPGHTFGTVLGETQEMFVKVEKRENEAIEISYFPLTKDHNEHVDQMVVRIFARLPCAVNKCLFCTKFFLNFSQRLKRYCSPKCVWKANAKQRRELDPEGYRKKQREIMWRTYPDRKAKEIGLKKVFVQRRKKREDYD